jgi:hypothetical protein
MYLAIQRLRSRTDAGLATVMAALFWFCAISVACAQDGKTTAKAAQGPREAANVFISGHSLTEPVDHNLEAIARSLGKHIRWNRQLILGSPIRARTNLHQGGERKRWLGYTSGRDKFNRPINVVEEFKTGTAIGGARYDVLLITERHDVLSVMLWESTVQELRDFHERLIELGASDAQTYFFEPWLDIADKDNPAGWMTFERASSQVWQCVTTRINTSLQAEGRSDRLLSLPVGLLLVDFVERAIAGRISGLTGSNTRAVVNRIFSDNVHLTPLGGYYAALLSYAAIYRQSPVGAWSPSGIDHTLAAELQELAWKKTSELYANYRPLGLDECRAFMREKYCSIWDSYVPDKKQPGCLPTFSRDPRSARGEKGPFDFDPATDKSYWFPPPVQ